MAKLYAHWITINYRESYNFFACSGILFNHESPVRGETFVTRKITRGLSRIKTGIDSKLYLGNIDAKRDWGHARDYVEAQWLMLQQDTPKDFVIASGIQYSVREFINIAAQKINLDLTWQGKGLDEKAYDKNGKCIIEIDKRYFRPAEVESLLGDSSIARKELGWQPKISFDDLVDEMIKKDLKEAKDFILINSQKS